MITGLTDLATALIMIGLGFLYRYWATKAKTQRAQTAWAIGALVCWGFVPLDIALGALHLTGVIQ